MAQEIDLNGLKTGRKISSLRDQEKLFVTSGTMKDPFKRRPRKVPGSLK
jgi:hypothetical protein